MSGDLVVSAYPDETDADRAKRIQKWKDAKFGLSLHWGPQRAGGESIIKPAILDKFNPVKFYAEQWVLTAKKLASSTSSSYQHMNPTNRSSSNHILYRLFQKNR